VNLVLRSTRVPIADPSNPMITVSFPVSWNGPVVDLGGPGADQDLLGDELLASAAGAGLGYSQGTAGAQACGQLPAKRSAALHVQGLVDRFVGDAHRVIIGEVRTQAGADLFRTPHRAPPPVRAPPMAASLPRHIGSRNRPALRVDDGAREAVLHVVAEPVVHGELGGLGPAGPSLGVPLSDRGPVVNPAAAGGRVAAQLPRDRRRRPAGGAGDAAHPVTAGLEQGDLLALGKRQVPPRGRSQNHWRHAATLAKPPRPDRRRHAHNGGGVLAGETLGHPQPKLSLHLPSVHCGTTRRPHRRPPNQIRPLRQIPSHQQLPRSRGVATTT